MKQSLIWRFVVIVLVLAAWVWSLFPLQEKPFLQTFRNLSEPQLEEYREELKTSEEEIASLEKELERIEDEDSEAYEELQASLEEIRTQSETAQRRLEQYKRILSETKRELEKDDTLAPYIALRSAARGDDAYPPVQLNHFINVPTQPNASNNLVLSHVRGKSAGKLKLGLDLRGGTEFVLGFDPDNVPKGRQPERVRDQIIEILRNRVDSLGVVEPEIKPIGPAAISLRMPSVSENEKADIRASIKQTANLTFHLVHENSDQLVQQFRQNPEEFTAPAGYKYYEMETVHQGQVETQGLFLKKRAERIRGEDVKSAVATFDEFMNHTVDLTFNDTGAAAFADVTSENVGRRLAIVLDGKVYSAPVIKDAITAGRAQISGSFTPEEAQRLAGVIESGNLPVSINIDSEFGTDPTLGKDSIRSGTLAALIGLAAVVVFMIIYYRLAGVIAVAALTANIFLVLGTLTLTGATITLPGIAGIVLTIGMAVDANVLIFERIREERQNGKSIGNAVKSGYSRAFVTILDSNLTTLLTALILLRFGTGPIRGFAVTLSIGIVASMFTALFMTRAIFDLLLYRGWLTTISMAQLLHKPDYKFLNLRKIAMMASAVVVVLSLGTWLVRGRDTLSIDFAGGTAITFRMSSDQQAPSVADVRDTLQAENFGDAQIGYKYSAGTEGKLLEVVLPEVHTDRTQFTQKNATLQAVLNRSFPEAGFSQVQTNSVGNLVGAQFQRKAFFAALFAAIGIIIYISFRFELAYGIAAVIALLHDVFIAIGIYVLAGRELSLPVVAALLTIMGYSLNDTIVVFDRIREDISLHKGRNYFDIVNLSINQTLSRTVLTSLTTLFVVLILFLFGGGAINDFALVMLIGVLVGTYSSIFVASNIIATWHKPLRSERVGTAARARA